jgi:hypothetical protein
MSGFPTVARLTTWTGLCPSSDESAEERCFNRVELATCKPCSVACARGGAKHVVLAVAASTISAERYS